MRRLIVNADDFGFTSGVNRAIVEANEHGIVTSSTLMANGPAFEEAVKLAKTVPNLSVGCHVVLIDGQPPGIAHGVDIDEQGNGTATQQRMYQLIRQPQPIVDRQFEIEFLDPGAAAFAFTFG